MVEAPLTEQEVQEMESELCSLKRYVELQERALLYGLPEKYVRSFSGLEPRLGA